MHVRQSRTPSRKGAVCRGSLRSQCLCTPKLSAFQSEWDEADDGRRMCKRDRRSRENLDVARPGSTRKRSRRWAIAPLQGSGFFVFPDPGRCPGLWHCAPLGLNQCPHRSSEAARQQSGTEWRPQRSPRYSQGVPRRYAWEQRFCTKGDEPLETCSKKRDSGTMSPIVRRMRTKLGVGNRL